jgi:hypothetical protein
MGQRQIDRRGSARRPVALPNAVEIRICGDGEPSRPIIAKLVDASAAGVGVETFTRLKRGTRVLVKANLQAPELALALSGAGVVAHSREVGPGRYIMGLKLQEVRYARAS